MVNGEDIGQNDWLSEQKMHLWHHELSFLQLVLNRFFAQRDSSCFFLRRWTEECNMVAELDPHIFIHLSQK